MLALNQSQYDELLDYLAALRLIVKSKSNAKRLRLGESDIAKFLTLCDLAEEQLEQTAWANGIKTS